jgi:hypothetical protein
MCFGAPLSCSRRVGAAKALPRSTSRDCCAALFGTQAMSLRWAIGRMTGLVHCERALRVGVSVVMVLALESVLAVDYTRQPDTGSWARTPPGRDSAGYDQRWTRDSQPWMRESVPNQPYAQQDRRDLNNGVPFSSYPEQERAWSRSTEGYRARDGRTFDRRLPGRNEGNGEPNQQYRWRHRSMEEAIAPRRAPDLEYAEPREEAWWGGPRESAWRRPDPVIQHREDLYDDGYWETPDEGYGSWGRDSYERQQDEGSEEIWGRDYSPEWNPEPAPYYHDPWAEPDRAVEERPWARRRPQHRDQDRGRADSAPSQPRQQWSEGPYGSPNPSVPGYAPGPYGGYPPMWGLPGWGVLPGLPMWDGLLGAGGWPWSF